MLDLEAIKKVLPHRYPFLLVDRILEIQPGQYCKALKNISAGDPVFEGHFPGNPVMPGVLMVEALAQTAGFVIHSSLENPPENFQVLFGGLDNVRFKKQVVPGDQLILETTFKNKKRNLWILEGKATVDSKIAVIAEIKLAIIE
ncbi:MAG: 3-hydroxyacyl-ACP dehydratase FabZ [SAR324 cluster bacterium]|nr:3-hydroxyacyl-ACP dehydratase FabZ [SAR324 cluster bacterium]MBF0352300.1 3-hydroxyacyl-ACP dehydratase FabZ [SAR324 cluster bacterium]